MGTTKRKRIYYTPGIISLTLLPFVFISYVTKEIKNHTLSAIPIYFADTNLLENHPEWFVKFKGHFPPKRNYLDITLNGNNKNDRIKLDFAQLRIREILSQNDSQNGVHFKFSDSSEYWTFVKSVDILRIEGAKTYMPLDNDLWFYHFSPDTTIRPLEYNCILCNYIVIVESKTSWWAKT